MKRTNLARARRMLIRRKASPVWLQRALDKAKSPTEGASTGVVHPAEMAVSKQSTCPAATIDELKLTHEFRHHAGRAALRCDRYELAPVSRRYTRRSGKAG